MRKFVTNMVKTRAAMLLLSLVLMRSGAELADFLLIESRQTFPESEQLCQAQGYDGLAVLSTPETYGLALHLTEYHRTVHGRSTYVGLRYQIPRDIRVWDDGTVPTADTPYKHGHANKASIGDPYGLLNHEGEIKWASGNKNKMALCGNHQQQTAEARGSNMYGQQPANVTWSLSLTTMSTYLECALLCGQDHRCRVAAFSSDLLTCQTLAAGSYTNFTQNSAFQTFLRAGFI
ncbi:hypothetical protein RRG08_059711 [Elysia crispata]|uniref:Apple domain-containing protein n=1 Tax=Elysia crispata TaxID=231223 RepID=A0AAE0ZD76_9GAST|nr:hypothetical protein RRG08_059711 [Elysia crispata]